jgi:hypothetical protein
MTTPPVVVSASEKLAKDNGDDDDALRSYIESRPSRAWGNDCAAFDS